MANRNKKEIQFEQPSDILLLANRYVMLMVGIIVLVVLIGGYLFLLQPKIKSIQSVQVEDQETEERRLQNQELLNNIKILEEVYLDIKDNRAEDLALLKKMVPTNPEIAELFVTANYLAQQNDFELVALDISEVTDDSEGYVKEVPAEMDGSQTTEEINDSINNPAAVDYVKDVNLMDSLKSLIIHMTVAIEDTSSDEIDPYTSFKQYLSDLETHLRLIDIQTVTFNEFAPAEEAEATEEGQEVSVITFNFDIITYFR